MATILWFLPKFFTTYKWGTITKFEFGQSAQIFVWEANDSIDYEATVNFSVMFIYHE